jgi:PAS domain S-box-containing protein
MIDHTNEILKTSDEINMHLSTLQLKRRGYVVRLEQKYLEDYDHAKSAFYKDLNKLNFLVSDNNVQLKEFLKLDSSSTRMVTLLDSTLYLFQTDKKVSEEQTRLALLSQDYLENCELITSVIKSNELKLLETRQNASKNSLQDTQIFIIYTSLFAFAVIGLSLFIFIRLIRNKNSAELLLRKSYDELEDRVELRTTELKTVNENLVSEVNNRIKIESSLRESEERFRLMADSAPVLIWVSGKDKRFTYVNKGWLDYTGRKIESELDTGWIENLHPEDLENYLSTYSVNFESRTSFEIEFRLRSFNGEYRWFLNKAIPRYKGNEFEGFIGICVDIHLKKRNERYLKIQYSVSKTLTESLSTEEALSRVLENICKGVNWKFGIAWVINENRLYQKAFWSENKTEISDYTSFYDKDFMLSAGEGLPGKIWKENKPYWSENIAGDDYVIRKDVLLKLGWNSAFGIPISDSGKVIAVIECFNHDKLSAKEDLLEVLESVGRQIGNFLERKKAEENLKIAYDELETRVNERTVELANTLNRLLDEMAIKEKVQNKLKLFGHTIKSIKEGVFITDLQSKTIFVNPAFESLYGYIENEIIGENIPVLYSKNISDEKRKEIISGALKSGWKGELINHKSDNTEFSVYLSASVIRDEEGKVDSIVGIVQDITEDIKNRELLEKRNSLLNLLNDVATGVNKIESVDKCIQFALNKVCEYTHWDIGHYLVYSNGSYIASGIWNQDLSSVFDVFRAFNDGLIFEASDGYYKNIFENHKPIWDLITNISDDSKYHRLAFCKKIGINTFIGIPVISSNKVIGIMEFFNKEEKLSDKEIIDCLYNIAMELGSFNERNIYIELIQESEKQLSLILDNIKDYAIILIDDKGYIKSWNKGAEQIKGYTKDEIIGKHISVFYRDEDADAYEPNKNLEIAKKLGRYEKEGWRVKKDGSLFLADVIFTPLYNEKNELTGFVKVTRDITERKQAEEAVRLSEMQLKEAQKIAKLGSWEWDAENDIVRWSEEMYTIFEVAPGTLITNDLYMNLLDDENKKQREIAINFALENNSPFNYFIHLKTSSGNEKILSSQGEIDLDSRGKIKRMVGTVMDVTKIKEAEDKLRENEKQLKEAQAIAKLGSWEADLKTGKISWSDEMYRIHDIVPGTESLDYVNIRKYIYHADTPQMDELYRRINKVPVNAEIDYRIVTREGRLKYLSLELRVEYDKENNPFRLYGSVQDITDIKLVEEELRKTNFRLIETQKELIHNEKLAALGRFSSGIAHEIRNPLANISALAQLVSKSKIEDEKMKKHLKYILVNSDIANKIIKDLLLFAAPEDLVLDSLLVKDILENTVNSFEARCEENGISVIRNISNELPEICADKVKLENALMNFISNAIDAMPGGGKLSIIANIDKIHQEVIIDIIDTGQGISPENLDKIFEPFFTTKETGTGLGLGLAYQTIRSHHGFLNITSEPDKGTHVEIRLPVKSKNENGKNSDN